MSDHSEKPSSKMEGKEKFLSEAREIIVGDEKLKLLLKEGKISQETFNDQHKEINARLAEIKENIAELDRKKNGLAAPASVEKFNSSFMRRQTARRKELRPGDDEALSNAGMAAVVFSAALVIGILLFPSAVYVTLPTLPEPYVLPDSSKIFGFLALSAAQTLIGGLFLWVTGRALKIKGMEYNKAIAITYSGSIISSGFLLVAGYVFSGGRYSQALELLGYVVGILSYYWAVKGSLKAGRLKMAFLSVATYAVNYALALASLISIIILL
jgi:hypothetical protein